MNLQAVNFKKIDILNREEGTKIFSRKAHEINGSSSTLCEYECWTPIRISVDENVSS